MRTALGVRRHRLDAAARRILVWLVERVQVSEATLLLFCAVAVGLLTGLAAVVFIRLIDVVTRLSFTSLPTFFGAGGRLWVILIPAVGGLLSGPIIAYFASEAKGHGVPEVMQALVLRGGRIRPRVAVAKIAASSICIGTGGSAGREGPIIQVGSTLGSVLGQILRMSDERIRNLVACGAAAGVAATFNAPIAGVAFSIEVLVGELGLSLVSNVVISAVTASVVSQAFLGQRAAFGIPSYRLNSPWELLFYVVLGALAALLGVLFIRVLYKAEDVFDLGLKLPMWCKPAIGGLLLGLVAFVYPPLLAALGLDPVHSRAGLPVGANIPHVFGSGFATIEDALTGPLPWILLAALVVLKLGATALTLGSGNSGGVFAPSLFMGAMLGGLFGLVIHQLAPQIAPHVGSYALAGMAATFAGAARAPLTSILIAFEMSNDYAVILPLMVSSIVAGVAAAWLHPDSIYSLKLTRRGIHLRHGRDVDVLDGVLVQEVMDMEPPTISAATPLQEVRDFLVGTHHHGALALDEKGGLVGVVTLGDIEEAMEQDPDWRERPAWSIMTRDLLVVHPDETIGAALQRLAVRDIGRLPVVDRSDPTRLLGIIRRVDITRAYQRGLVRRSRLQERAGQLQVSRRAGVRFLELEVQAGSAVAGRRVRELKLPGDVLLTTKRNGRGSVLLHGDDLLEPGDIVLALADPECAEEVEALFAGSG